MTQREAWKLHERAMELAGRADIVKHGGNADGAKAMYAGAFELEKESALFFASIAHEKKIELSAGILCRSAGWLAFNLGMYAEAEAMAKRGLEVNPHAEIQRELIELLEEVQKATCEPT